MICTPISLTGAKKRRYNRQRNAFQPLTARSRERFPLSRGNKLSTERTAIPNLNRRRSGRQRIFIFPLPPDRFFGFHQTAGNGLDRSVILPPLKGDSPVRGDVERSETEGSAVCGEQRWILPAGQKTKGFYIFKPLSLLCRQLPC